jgi:hypothetical protein
MGGWFSAAANPAKQRPTGESDDRLGRVVLAFLDQLGSGRRVKGMLDPRIQVSNHLENAFPC